MAELGEDVEGMNAIASIKEVALMHIKKISEICCQEFRPGYWEEKPIKVAGGISMTKVYHPDSREMFINAIRFLGWLIGAYADDKSNFHTVITENKDFFENYNPNDKDIEKKMSLCFKIFKEMNVFFRQDDFFDASIYRNE